MIKDSGERTKFDTGAVREADRPPEHVVMFRRMIKSMCTIFHLRILGKVTIVDEKGRRW